MIKWLKCKDCDSYDFRIRVNYNNNDNSSHIFTIFCNDCDNWSRDIFLDLKDVV